LPVEPRRIAEFLRYALWGHAGVPDGAEVDRQWQSFAREELASMQMKPSPKKKPATPEKP